MIRRRRLALAAVALVAAVAGAIAGADSESPSRPATATQAMPTCPEAVAGDPRRLAGSMVIARMEAEATPQLRRAVRRGEIGGVVAFPPEGTAPEVLRDAIADLDRAAASTGMPAPIVAIDQEGGDVERLPQLPPDGGAPDMAEPARASAQGRATGEALAELGVDVDLAPVLDVPAVPGAFMASRAFADDPAEAGAAGVAFATGLQDSGVAATAKHFPGLGAATVNTDEAPSTVDASRRQLDDGLEPFEAAVAADVGLVMTANAVYPALDPDRPAALSRRIVTGLLRKELAYDGVIITDDLGAGAITGSGYAEGPAAVAAAAAGSDLLLFALSDGAEARAALVDAIRSGEADRETLVASCTRLTALRERFAGG